MTKRGIFCFCVALLSNLFTMRESQAYLRIVGRSRPTTMPCEQGVRGWHWSDPGCPDNPVVGPCVCLTGPAPTPRPWLGLRPVPKPSDIPSYNLPLCDHEYRICGTWFRKISPQKDPLVFAAAHAVDGWRVIDYWRSTGKLPAQFFSFNGFLNNRRGEDVWASLKPLLEEYIKLSVRERRRQVVLPPPVVVTAEVSIFEWSLREALARSSLAKDAPQRLPREMADIFSQEERALIYAILDFNRTIAKSYGPEYMVRIVIAPYLFGWANRLEDLWPLVGSAEPWALDPDGVHFLDRPTPEVIARDHKNLDDFLYALKGTADAPGQQEEIASVIVQASNAYGYCGEGVESIASGIVEVLQNHGFPPEVQIETANWCDQHFKNVQTAPSYADCRALRALEAPRNSDGIPEAFISVWSDDRLFSEDGRTVWDLIDCPRDW